MHSKTPQNHIKNQYTRELLFSSIVDLMSLVVCGIYPSVNAAYRAKASSLNVSRTAVYGKLNGIYLVLVLRCYLERMPVVLDPELPMAIDVFPCEDGHAQEPSLCESVLQTVKADELWIADRNMCTQGFLFGISTASSDFLIREHKTLPQQAISELQFQGDVETKAVE